MKVPQNPARGVRSAAIGQSAEACFTKTAANAQGGRVERVWVEADATRIVREEMALTRALPPGELIQR